jgi:CRP-like cAMP-binding protein
VINLKIKELVNTKYKLEKLPIFRGLSKEKILEIINYSDFKIKKFEKQETLSFRGDKINDIMIVLDGELRGEMQKFNGDTITIDFLKQNDMIAPAFIFGINNDFPVDLIANTNSTILSLNKSSLITLLSENELLLTNFLNEVSNKSQLLSKRIWFNFVNKTIYEKIVAYIYENHIDDVITFKPNISELAKKFEITRPSLSREISALCETGLLTKIAGNSYKVNTEELFT